MKRQLPINVDWGFSTTENDSKCFKFACPRLTNSIFVIVLPRISGDIVETCFNKYAKELTFFWIYRSLNRVTRSGNF